GYFEWARMVEAMANGCVVVTEASLGHEPLVAGDHFIETSLDQLTADVLDVLGDDNRRSRIAAAAHHVVMNDLALGPAVGELLDLIEREELGLEPGPQTRRQRRARRRPIIRGHKPPLLPAFAPYQAQRRAIYDRLLAEIDHRRELGRFRALLEYGDSDHVGKNTTSAWNQMSSGDGAEVSVIMTLFNYADVVIETLDSIVASADVVAEIVIVDDHSSDDGVDVVRQWMADHDDVAVLLLTSAANLVYPTCLRRRADALASDPEAAFAFSTLEAFGAEPGLRSAQGWHVPWLCEANYIDAQAMLRRSTLDRHEGYRVDDTMYGWEDWDLWLRIAVAGEYGLHVPEMLGRYRTQPSSMVSLTNLVADDLRADLVARYPTLPWPGT
ncbi:glycosyltransferase, partial [bacterium]|nr:glycosyltransferase [bacterium]